MGTKSQQFLDFEKKVLEKAKIEIVQKMIKRIDQVESTKKQKPFQSVA